MSRKDIQKQEMLFPHAVQQNNTKTQVISAQKHVEPLTIYNGISPPLGTRLWFSGCKQNVQSS